MTTFNEHRDNDAADVIVVGYGPVGQALSLRLAQLGHQVIVIERWGDLYGLPRAVGLDHEALRILQSTGVMHDFSEHMVLSHVYEWRNGQGDVLTAFPGLDQPSASAWPNRCSFHQPALERLLDERLRSAHRDRARVLNRLTVSRIVAHDDGVLVQAHPTDNPDAPAHEFRARYVVGCDGAGSFVRQAMGVSVTDLGFTADWLVVDLRPKDPAQWRNDLIQVCDPNRPTTMVAAGPGRRRFEFMALAHEKKDDLNNVQTAWGLLAPWGWNPENAELERHAVYTFRSIVADTWRRGRLMIAGDAAHLTPPFAAQGLCAGLRDVAALAWRLDAVLRGVAPEAMLDDYSDERRPHARALVEFAVMLGHIICELDPDAAAQRDLALQERAKCADQREPTPRLGPSALMRDGDDTSGTLGRQGHVRYQGRTGRFDDVVGSGFVLIGNGHDPLRSLSRAQRDFLTQIDATVVGVGAECDVEDIGHTYAQWFETLGCDTVLVRPDYYMFGSGEASALVSDLMQAWQRSGSQATLRRQPAGEM
ncbi:bifunctional 3-(3-hydroxy-phenyl)propionate/3-hydroxycinnamic acid hydroxylase [Pandoraea bronchicola]|uniref:Monooxygenase FAD-binding protein n=1 Tax=Pandoraea bronchicola TaxID=2508287 RepID=A0A5E5BYS7_9BURK|nr:bifunctional 3-(3-hydroxy-phenyl)propionate/3-hydroxycinnamic acid hydroxylase [Pandoraea bronchicola]VVE90486.1 monooxygenase FAD-binding protein [Pandoraea bronchicola]